MGRRPVGETFSERRFVAAIHVTGRSATLDREWVTILVCARRWCAVWCHEQERVAKITRPPSIVMSANRGLPKRWTRSDGYRCVYLGRAHPLANAGGYQYEHRLVAMGFAMRSDPPPVRLVGGGRQ